MLEHLQVPLFPQNGNIFYKKNALVFKVYKFTKWYREGTYMTPFHQSILLSGINAEHSHLVFCMNAKIKTK